LTGSGIALPTSACHRELRRDDIPFTKEQHEGIDVVTRARVMEGEVKKLTQLHRLEMINL
jgi:hypothetical protein